MQRLDRNHLLIAIAGALVFIPFLGSVHLFDWDEINFAECAREMLLTGEYFKVQINFQPFWEKPPLFIWLQAMSMSLFGVNEFAARLPNALIGVATLITIYEIGKTQFSKKFGLLWALAFAGSVLPFVYFKSGIIDPLFNLFIFLGIVCSARFLREKISITGNLRWAALSGVAIGLAILTKGPAALLIYLLCLMGYCLLQRMPLWNFWREGLLFCLVICSVAAIWIVPLILSEGSWILYDFIRYQVRLFSSEEAGHGGNFFFHWVVLWFGCFPASMLVFPSLLKFSSDLDQQKQFKRWMIMLLIVVLLLFSVVQTKIVHYSSLCYFPVSFLAAYFLYKCITNLEEVKSISGLKSIIAILFAFTGFIVAAVIIALPLAGMYPHEIAPYIHDAFAQAALKAEVAWSPWDMTIGFTYLAILMLVFIFIVYGKMLWAFVFAFAGTIIVTFLTITLFAPRIEQYSQGDLISFIESLKEEDCYVQVLGFQSYAHLFYSEKQPEDNSSLYFKEWLKNRHMQKDISPKELDQQYTGWLLNGIIDKPAYFVCKITRADEYRKIPGLIELGPRNGYLFWWRDVVMPPKISPAQ